MEKVWYKRPALWGAIILGICTVTQGIASVDAAWDRIQRTAPIVFSILNPGVSFFATSITLPLWVIIVSTVLLLAVPYLARKAIYPSEITSSSTTPIRITESISSSTTLPPLHEKPANFREVWVDWIGKTKGIGVNKPLRCAKPNCTKRIVNAAVIDEGKFLVCEAGHLVGNEQGEAHWRAIAQRHSEARDHGFKLAEREKLHNYALSTPNLTDDFINQFIDDFITEHERQGFQHKISNRVS